MTIRVELTQTLCIGYKTKGFSKLETASGTSRLFYTKYYSRGRGREFPGRWYKQEHSTLAGIRQEFLCLRFKCRARQKASSC